MSWLIDSPLPRPCVLSKPITSQPDTMSSSSSNCECAICYDAITVKTGSVTLGGCAHLYHFRCISSWFASQEVSTCPLCRKEMTELADFAPPAEGEQEDDEDDEDDDEDDDDYDDDDDEEFIRISRASIDDFLIAQGSSRSDGSIDTLAVAEGHSSEDTPTFDEEGYTIVARIEMDTLFQAAGSRLLTDAQWAVLVAEFPLPASLQEVGLESFASFAAEVAALRQEQEQQEQEQEQPTPIPTSPIPASASLPPLSITWHLQEGGRWMRQVLNPEEDTGVSATAVAWAEPLPVSAEVAAAAAAAAAESLQHAWHGFKERREAKARLLAGMRHV